jgi:hypothetical protein
MSVVSTQYSAHTTIVGAWIGERNALAASKAQRQIQNPKSEIPLSILPRDSTFRQALFRALFQTWQIWKRKKKSGKEK